MKTFEETNTRVELPEWENEARVSECLTDQDPLALLLIEEALENDPDGILDPELLMHQILAETIKCSH